MTKMKLALTGLAVCAIQYMAAAVPLDSKGLPRAVSNAFTQQYPGAKLMNWQLQNADYIVNFKTSSEQSAAHYTPDGVWLRTDTKIADKKDLPDAVRNGLENSKYGKYTVENMEKVRQPAGKTLYVFSVEYGENIDPDAAANDNDYMLYFDRDGHLQGAVNSPDQIATKP